MVEELGAFPSAPVPHQLFIVIETSFPAQAANLLLTTIALCFMLFKLL